MIFISLKNCAYAVVNVTIFICYSVRGKILMGKNWWIWRIMSYLPKYSSQVFRYTPKMYLAYALSVAYLPNFSLPIAFSCMVQQNFLLPNIFHVQYWPNTMIYFCSLVAPDINLFTRLALACIIAYHVRAKYFYIWLMSEPGIK